MNPDLILYIIIAVVVFFIPILPNLWAIWHIFHNEFDTYNQKMMWLCIAVFIPVVGGIIYLFIGRKKVKRDEQV